jgi:hypothetical protein
MFGLQVPIEFNSRLPIQANHTSARQGAMFKVPAQWRELTIVHEATGEPEKVRVRIAGVGSRYKTDDVKKLVGGAADYLVAHSILWDSAWVNAPSPCLYSGVGWYTETTFRFFGKHLPKPHAPNRRSSIFRGCNWSTSILPMSLRHLTR